MMYVCGRRFAAEKFERLEKRGKDGVPSGAITERWGVGAPRLSMLIDTSMIYLSNHSWLIASCGSLLLA